jgi:ubiquitin carboxyl-terminal hydrolase 7
LLSLPASAHHRFNEKETDWGFSQFFSHASLAKPVEGSGGKTVLENDGFSLTVHVKEIVDENGTLWHNFVE